MELQFVDSPNDQGNLRNGDINRRQLFTYQKQPMQKSNQDENELDISNIKSLEMTQTINNQNNMTQNLIQKTPSDISNFYHNYSHELDHTHSLSNMHLNIQSQSINLNNSYDTHFLKNQKNVNPYILPQKVKSQTVAYGSNNLDFQTKIQKIKTKGNPNPNPNLNPNPIAFNWANNCYFHFKTKIQSFLERTI
ncbi:hypothetical protein PPERSA_13155 [Pseudocohnilembus persalinus]|uniref:Uncharacterized protein n=1 Tax=Pseudocohnilembus persalinus TaxID=266149 RepID=A0A0V0QBW3_PSEPJ|nr:hypothetical protein PPERSA_13155 [Pseudocohnilembus persalinus]|eukprot:KRW99575.1 hypothetical protein PPERSA_13155 [Pseudocohnilembus persalinus]